MLNNRNSPRPPPKPKPKSNPNLTLQFELELTRTLGSHVSKQAPDSSASESDDIELVEFNAFCLETDEEAATRVKSPPIPIIKTSPVTTGQGKVDYQWPETFPRKTPQTMHKKLALQQ